MTQSTTPAPLRFLAIGECMAELAPGDSADQLRLGFAGDTFNTAFYLRQLLTEAEVRYFSRVGQDSLSDRMTTMMRAAGVDTTFVAADPQRSVGMYLISLKDGERSFSYWRDSSAARLLASDRGALDRAMEVTGLIYFSGITLAILDAAGRATLLDAVAKARRAGRTIAFDSNLRPRLWATIPEMTQTIMAAAQVSDIVLPSFDDEAVHFGDADPDATADRYLRAGAETVIVKNGAGPVHYRSGGGQGVVTPPVAQAVVDTTAAGDSFNAGFLAGRASGLPVDQAILSGARVAAKVIGHKGALVPLT